MRKISIIAASILAMVGCAKNAEFDNTHEAERVEMTVSAVKEMPEASRVAFNGGIEDMIWEADDQIGVHIESTGETAKFSVKELSADSQTARFRADIYEPAVTDSYYAYYPATTGISGTNVNFILPNEYNAAGASEPYLVASCKEVGRYDVELEFRPVTALLELSLGFAANKVVIESINGESLSGVLLYNCADGSLTQPTGNASITLNSFAAGTHYIYMPEVTLAKGYKVTVTVGEQQMIKTVNYGKEKKFVAGEVTPLSIPSFEGVAVNLCDVYTTYTLYKRGNSEANNTSLTNTITFSGDCSYAGISSTLVAECGVNINGENITATPSNKKFTIDNQTDKGQGAYTVYAYVKTIDGTIYKSAEQTHYITGLPYTVSFTTSAPAGWTVSNTGKQSDYLCLNKGDAYAISPRFTLPESTNVKASFNLYPYAGIAAGYQPSVYISASESDVKNNLVYTFSKSNNDPIPREKNGTNVSAQVELTNSVGKVCLHTYGEKRSGFLYTGTTGMTISIMSSTINYAL